MMESLNSGSISKHVGLFRAAVLIALTASFVLGVALRLRYYSYNYSLFFDECALTQNIENRSYGNLSQTLEYDQAAPFGFLYLQKIVISVLGDSEAALRALPLTCGMLAIVAFYFFTRKLLKGWALVAANVLMGVNQLAINYSAICKQYSTEMLVAVVMLMLSYPLFDRSCPRGLFWRNSVILGLLPWFSFSALFMLAGIGIIMACAQASGGRWLVSKRIAWLCLLWVALLLPIYQYSIRPGTLNSSLHTMWAEDYMPLQSLADCLGWIWNKFVEVCEMAFNKRLWFLAAAGITVGTTASVLHRDWAVLAGAAALCVCYGAAALHQYPVRGRLVLFAMPVLILLLVRGYEWLRRMFAGVVLLAADAIVGAALLWCTLSAIKAVFLYPTYIDQPREVLRFARSQWRPGDRLYATPYSTACVLYYRKPLDWAEADFNLNVKSAEDEETTPTRLTTPVLPGRSWLVEMRTPWKRRGESVPVREYFDAHGKWLAQKDVEWTSVTLYEIH
ncbi:MAG TPA: hypothetical protein VEV17_09625 [Bryobacteraceae bacterium]|nr:hypothetical protein [Bryobacteraceae bacterium]